MRPRCCPWWLHNTGRACRRPGRNTEEISQRHPSRSPEDHILSGVTVFSMGWRQFEEAPLCFQFGRKVTLGKLTSQVQDWRSHTWIQVHILFLQDCFQVLRTKHIIRNPRKFSAHVAESGYKRHNSRAKEKRPEAWSQQKGLHTIMITSALISLTLFP